MIQTWIIAALLSTMLFYGTASEHDTTMNNVQQKEEWISLFDGKFGH